MGAQIHAGKASRRRKTLLCTLKGLHKQREAGKGMPDRGWGWELGARSPVRLKCPVCRQGPQRPLSSQPSAPQGKAELWGRGVQGWAGPARSFYHHWVGSKVCGGSDHPLPASHFFFLLLACLAFSPRLHFHNGPSWLAGCGHGCTTRPAAGAPGPGLPAPLWVG